MKTTNTPTPWHVGTDGNVYSGATGGVLVAVVSHEANGPLKPSSKPANAALIVRAANAHADLLAALKMMCETVKMDLGMFPDQPRKGSVMDIALSAIALAEGR